MSVPERPDESVEWAESPHAEVEEPEELRLYGWPYGFVPPSAAFNWLQRSVGRWIKWLEAKVDGHVHDGGSDPGSVAKVDVKEHLGWGEQGYLEVTSDTPDVHRVEHHHKNGNPAIAEFVSGILRARTLLRFPGGLVRKIPFSGDVEVELDEPGAELTVINPISAPNVFDVMVIVNGATGEVVDGYGRTSKFQPLGSGSYRIGRADSSTPSFVAHITAVDNQANSASLRWGPNPGDGWLIDFSAGEPSYFLYCEKRF